VDRRNPQQQLEHEAGLFTLRTDAEPGHRVSIYGQPIAYIEEILMGQHAESPQWHCRCETSHCFD